MRVKPIQWSKPLRATIEIRYVVGECPLGRFLITWRGWPEYSLDISPFEGYKSSSSLESLKEECEKEYTDKVLACIDVN